MIGHTVNCFSRKAKRNESRSFHLPLFVALWVLIGVVRQTQRVLTSCAKHKFIHIWKYYKTKGLAKVFFLFSHLGILIKNSNILLYYTYIQLFRTRLYSRTSVFSLIWFVDIIVLKSKDVLSLSQRLFWDWIDNELLV